jgi:hypothetical protein
MAASNNPGVSVAHIVTSVQWSQLGPAGIADPRIRYLQLGLPSYFV